MICGEWGIGLYIVTLPCSMIMKKENVECESEREMSLIGSVFLKSWVCKYIENRTFL